MDCGLWCFDTYKPIIILCNSLCFESFSIAIQHHLSRSSGSAAKHPNKATACGFQSCKPEWWAVIWAAYLAVWFSFEIHVVATGPCGIIAEFQIEGRRPCQTSACCHQPQVCTVDEFVCWTVQRFKTIRSIRVHRQNTSSCFCKLQGVAGWNVSSAETQMTCQWPFWILEQLQNLKSTLSHWLQT